MHVKCRILYCEEDRARALARKKSGLPVPLTTKLATSYFPWLTNLSKLPVWDHSNHNFLIGCIFLIFRGKRYGVIPVSSRAMLGSSRSACFSVNRAAVWRANKGFIRFGWIPASAVLPPEQKWADTVGRHTPRHAGSGMRDPGCHGKGHPDFTMMDSGGSAARKELSWVPWQQATDRSHRVGAWSFLIDLTQPQQKNTGSLSTVGSIAESEMTVFLQEPLPLHHASNLPWS